MMHYYTPIEIARMRTAFNTIEDAYLLMDPESFEPETREHRRLNQKIVEELEEAFPDHEKIYLLLTAINTIQNGKQPTATAFPSEEEPKSEKISGLKRRLKKIYQAWKQARQGRSTLPQ
jgi:hypothetical protein